MKIIAIIVIFLLSSFTMKEDRNDAGCLRADILLLADLSSSIAGYEEFIHDAAYTFIDKFELADNGIRIGFITFSSLAYLHYPLSSDKDSLKLATSILAPRMSGGSTNLSQAFEIATNELSTNGRPDALKMVLVITDGEPDDLDKTIDRATILKQTPGTMIWCIFVSKAALKSDPDPSQYWFYGVPSSVSSRVNGLENLKKIASPNCVIESDYNNLVDQIKKLDICL